MMQESNLMYVPDSDRVVLAVTDLHMRWNAADRKFSEQMVADVARNWGVGPDDTDELEVFLCGFVMDIRLAQGDDDPEEF